MVIGAVPRAARPTVAAYLAVSLDGFIARDDGTLDWLARFEGLPGEDYGYSEFFAGVDAVVMGRATWQAALGFDDWPFAAKRVVVLSTRDIEAAHGEVRYAGPLVDLLATLAGDGVRRVYLDGGAAIRQALAADQLEELTLSIIPVLLGRGRPLFGPEVPETRWQLVHSRSFANGLVQVSYRRDSTGPS